MPTSASLAPSTPEVKGEAANVASEGVARTAPNQNQPAAAEVEGRGKRKVLLHGRGKGIGALPKGRGPAAPGWTGAGFDVDGRS